MAKQRSITSFFPGSAAKRPRLTSSEGDSDIGGADLLSEDDLSGDNDAEISLDSEVPSDNCSSSSTTCSSDCCADPGDEAYRPSSSSSITKKRQGKQSRSFQTAWFDQHKWLTYCVTRNKVFCRFCRAAVTRGLIDLSNKTQKSAFVTGGFENWKKAKQRFKEHERCQMHREACIRLQSCQRPSVAAQLSHQLLIDQKYRREMLMKVLSTLRFLLQQGLPIRGHKEEDSNLIQLLKCRSEDIQDLQCWLDNGKYLSHDIINEMIEIMAHEVLRSILAEVKDAKWFALIADETRDISGVEQFAVSLRWVDTCYNVYEDIIGMVEVDQTDAATLSSTLKDVLIRCGLPLSNCRGQTYDGASNMSGHLSGVASRLKQEEPRAFYVHCVAHCLNLCLQDCAHQCPCIRDALALANDMSTLIHSSPKRLALFRYLKEQLSPGSPGLKPLCPTRWTVRTGAIDAILKNYSVISEELEQIEVESHSESSRKALGLLALMERFSTYFGLKLSFLVFSATEQASSTLQYKDINAQEAAMAIDAARSFLGRQRSDSAFDGFYQSVVNEASNYTQDPTLPRQKRIPRRLDDGASNHVYSSPKEYYQQQYYQVLDVLTEEMTRRFDQPTFTLLREMENLVIQSCNGISVIPSSSFKGLYGSDMKMDSLMTQLSMLPDVVTTANKQEHMGIKRVTSVNTVCEVFNACKFSKTMLAEVDHFTYISEYL